MRAEAPVKSSAIWFGVGARRYAEVVFELSLVAVVNQIDAGINASVLDSPKLGNIAAPFGGIIADEIVALAGKRLGTGNASRAAGPIKPHPNHRTGLLRVGSALVADG